MTPLFVALVAVIAGMVAISKACLSIRAIAYVNLVGCIFLLWQSSLGKPRPVGWNAGISGRVVAYQLEEPVAILVWIVPNGELEPIYIKLPWRRNKAQKLVAAAAAAKANHSAIMADIRKHPHKGKGKAPAGQQRSTLHRMSPVFYGAPPPMLPPKHNRN